MSISLNNLYDTVGTTEEINKEQPETTETTETNETWEDSNEFDVVNDQVTEPSLPPANPEPSLPPANEDQAEEHNDFFESVNDDFLLSITDLYTPEGMENPNVDKVPPKKQSTLYEVKVNTDEYKQVIANAYDNAKFPVASYSLEELGLNNRLLYVSNASRDLENSVIIDAPTGNLVVAKELDTQSNILDKFMAEAKQMVQQGKRIEIPLIERYKFEDSHGRILERERFRASLSEIREFIRMTQMRGRITKDAFLIIYE